MAEFSPEVPFAAAIGASMLSSLLLPIADAREENGGNSAIDAGDTRAGFLLGLIRGSGATPRVLLYTWLLTSDITFRLEASLKNGDLQGFHIFSEAAKHLSSRSREEDTHFKGHKEPEVRERGYRNLPDAEEQSRNEIWHWGIPRRPSEHCEQSNGDWGDYGRSEQ